MTLISADAKKRPGQAQMPCPKLMLSAPVELCWYFCSLPGLERSVEKRKPWNRVGSCQREGLRLMECARMVMV
jgi:hypothetical protein